MDASVDTQQAFWALRFPRVAKYTRVTDVWFKSHVGCILTTPFIAFRNSAETVLFYTFHMELQTISFCNEWPCWSEGQDILRLCANLFWIIESIKPGMLLEHVELLQLNCVRLSFMIYRSRELSWFPLCSSWCWVSLDWWVWCWNTSARWPSLPPSISSASPCSSRLERSPEVTGEYPPCEWTVMCGSYLDERSSNATFAACVGFISGKVEGDRASILSITFKRTNPYDARG